MSPKMKRRRRPIRKKPDSPKKESQQSDDAFLARARAEARVLAVEVNDGPPNLAVSFVEADRHEIDSHRASCGEREFRREASESLAVFQKRVHDSLPLGCAPRL